MSRNSPKYLAYMQSDAWALRSRACLARAAFRCEQCGSTDNVQAHHRTYARLADELPEDLVALCKRHHDAAHARADWLRRMNGWASRKYGHDWAERLDSLDIEDQFEAWLERQEMSL